MTAIAAITQETIQNQIFTIRGKQVMLDRDLAVLYDIPTKALNQAVKRNIGRFPERFCFELNKVETDELVTGCDRFKSLKHSTSQVKAFSEQGIALLSTVLRSEIAIVVSIQIMDAFVEMRRFLRDNTALIYQKKQGNSSYHLYAEHQYSVDFGFE